MPPLLICGQYIKSKLMNCVYTMAGLPMEHIRIKENLNINNFFFMVWSDITGLHDGILHFSQKVSCSNGRLITFLWGKEINHNKSIRHAAASVSNRQICGFV